MNLYNSYMENIRKSKEVALELLEDTRDIIDGVTIENEVKHRTRETPNSDIEVDVDPGPSSQNTKRPTEFVKYGKITFDTTAILHHYPQSSQKKKPANAKLVVKVATKKSDLNLPTEGTQDNNNDVKSENKEKDEGKKDNVNNNKSVAKANCVVKADNTIEVLNKPVKFTEEKLV